MMRQPGLVVILMADGHSPHETPRVRGSEAFVELSPSTAIG